MESSIERIIVVEDELFDLGGASQTVDLVCSVPQPAKPKISLEMVEGACSSLADSCISVSARPFFKTVSRTAVLEKVQFLNNCLAARGKFIHSCREQAWRKYYHAYTQHMGEVTGLTGAPATSAWLCIYVFEVLLDEAYPLAQDSEEKARQCFQLQEDTKDIVAYIGGSIVTKLRQKAVNLQDTEKKEAMLDCLSELCDVNDELSENSDCRLTKTLNRGGLVFLKTSAQHFFQLLEMEAQRACNTVHEKAHLTLTEFVEECAADETLTSAFYSATYNACCTEEKRLFIFAKISQLYYKIRVHHECKLFLERLKCKASKTAVQKQGLRRTLKAQNSFAE